MPSETPEKGDKVSWTWGGSAPSGEVSEKKTEGEVSVTSKRGNVISKSAEPNDPAIAITRSGNDVVKNQSELEVEEKRPIPKKRGRPPKKAAGSEEEKESAKSPAKRKRGAVAEDAENGDVEEEKDEEAPPTKRTRGAKQGAATTTREADEPKTDEAPRKRGRPKGTGKKAFGGKKGSGVPKVYVPTGKPRGRPPGSGKKTAAKKAAPKAAAAPGGTGRGRGRPRKNAA